MTKIRDLFNAVAQGAKDTINGLDFKTFEGKVQIGFIGLAALFTVTASSALGVALPVLAGSAMLWNCHRNGKHRRQAGLGLRLN